jgi:hypothetical protein
MPLNNLLQRVLSSKSGKHRIDGRIIFTGREKMRQLKLEVKEAFSRKKFIFFTQPDGTFTLKLPDGKFAVFVRQFGVKQLGKTDFILSDGECPTRLDIKVKQTEQIIVNPPSSRFICFAKLIWLALAVAGFILNFLNVEYLVMSQSLIILTLAMISAYMAVQSERMFFKLMDFTNKPLRSKKIIIKNSQGQTLASIPTNQSGKINIFASHGIYKIEADSHLQRAFRVNQDSIVNLKLKL